MDRVKGVGRCFWDVFFEAMVSEGDPWEAFRGRVAAGAPFTADVVRCIPQGPQKHFRVQFRWARRR